MSMWLVKVTGAMKEQLVTIVPIVVDSKPTASSVSICHNVLNIASALSLYV